MPASLPPFPSGSATRRQALGAAGLTVLLPGLAGCSEAHGGESLTESRGDATDYGTLLPIEAGQRVLFFGDSWTAGESAGKSFGYANVVAESMDWTLVNPSDGSGTGYAGLRSPGGKTYPDRAGALPAQLNIRLVILQGSVNDIDAPLRSISANFVRTVGILREKTNFAPVVAVGPAVTSGDDTSDLEKLDQVNIVMRAAAHSKRVPFISPSEDAWFTINNAPYYFDVGTGHPNDRGHAYFGGRLVESIVKLRSADDAT